jgi:ubiquitin-conjugating enzyme E2 A
MATPAQRRLMNDLKSLQKEETLVASPRDDNIMIWDAVLPGPDDTPWEGGLFNLVLTFSDEYPNQPPRVKFTTPGVFHPNVYTNGDICLDILKSSWSPAYDVRMLLLSIQSLLAEPNPASAANAEAAELITSNRTAYEARVRKTVEEALAAMEGDEEDCDGEDGEEEPDPKAAKTD